MEWLSGCFAAFGALISAIMFLSEPIENSSDMTIRITASQWKWHYDYDDQNISFFSSITEPKAEIFEQEKRNGDEFVGVDQPLVIPVNTKIRFILTAVDVIHTWSVPDLGWKRDAIPGMVDSALVAVVNEPGTYRGKCAELCGRGHDSMAVVVQVLSKEDYKLWLIERQRGSS